MLKFHHTLFNRHLVKYAFFGLLACLVSVGIGAGATYIVGEWRGSSGRGDIWIVTLTTAALLYWMAFFFRYKRRWSLFECAFALVPFEVLFWICTAWVSTDGSIAGFLRFRWIEVLFSKFVVLFFVFYNIYIAFPWFMGLLTANLVAQRRFNAPE